jgi:hypothetical protein
LLVVEQLLEIIFTLLTLNVPDELPAPVEVELAPAPPLMLPAALPEVEPLAPALPDTEPLGLDELLLEPPASDPLIRT